MKEIVTPRARRKATQRLLLLFAVGLAFFTWVWCSKAATGTPLVLRLYHDENHDGQFNGPDRLASLYPYEWMFTNGSVELGGTGITAGDGTISTEVFTGTWTLRGEAVYWQMTIKGDEVIDASVREIPVGQHVLWLPQLHR